MHDVLAGHGQIDRTRDEIDVDPGVHVQPAGARRGDHRVERIERRRLPLKIGRARLDAAGKAALRNNEVVDAELVEVEPCGGEIRPVRLRERIRAAGPTNRTDLGKQSRPGRLPQAA